MHCSHLWVTASCLLDTTMVFLFSTCFPAATQRPQARPMHRSGTFGKAKGTSRPHLFIIHGNCILTLRPSQRVYQLELLEFQDTGDLTPHGVVLALVGSEVESPTNSKERDVLRSIRMYNLSSLTSLARWATSQKVSRFPACVSWASLIYR